jgi:endonuclease I
MTLAKLIKSVIGLNVVTFLFAGALAQASDDIPYYGDDFYQGLQAGVSGLDLQIELREILSSYHIARDGKNDLISKVCSNSQGHCYAQNVVGYKAARNFVTRGYYMRQLADGSTVISDVYCDRSLPLSRNGSNSPVNVEHTWPQSHFTRAYPEEMQKSDLHHLFPTDSYVNMIRGNHIFGEVDTDEQHLDCKGPRFGLGTGGSQEVFEPPQNHKGNVARALFYFATRYELKIGKDEEVILRKWNLEDPVDEQEMDRNNEIFKLQNNRNPFIDFPELVDRISDF